MFVKPLVTFAATAALLSSASVAAAESDSVRAIKMAEDSQARVKLDKSLEMQATAATAMATPTSTTIINVYEAPQSDVALSKQFDPAIDPLVVNPPLSPPLDDDHVTWPGELAREEEALTPSTADVSAFAPEPAPGLPLPEVVIQNSSSPVPDTLENRARYGGPESRGGRMTAPIGN